jgi:putative ABC transport system permease protein
LARLGGGALPYLLAARNIFRRRARLILALALLSAAGGLFMTALNVRDGWRAMADRVMTDRFYDAALLLNDPAPISRVAEVLSSVDGIRKFEVWGSSQTAFVREGRIDVMRTYPDRGHGSFTLFGVPPQTAMIRFPMVAGRWLAEGDIDTVVIAQRTLREIPGARIGDRIMLSLGGRPTAWRLVGVVLEVGGSGAYVSIAGYARASGSEPIGSDIRLVTSAVTVQERARVVAAVERGLDQAGFPVQRSMPLDQLHAAMVGHVEVPVRMLIAASVLLALIGGIGLASMMMVNVLERTREVGVMKAIGARSATIVTVIVGEGVLIGAASWVLALLVSLPLTLAIGLLGRMMLGTLPFMLSIPAAAGWLALVITTAAIASAAPALRAARVVVREALAYE